jgi:hypothetical protein
MAVAEVQAGAAGAMPTCPACAAVHAYQPAQADVKAAQALMPPGTREDRYRQCVTRRKHTVADTATVGVQFCAACLTTFALGKALDAPGRERARVPVPIERPRAGDLMILEHADGVYGVYRLSRSGERVFVRRGFATPGEAWEAARGELGVQARLWVGHADDPDNLQAY